MNVKPFITAIIFGLVATTSYAESDSELAAKVFFPTAEECAIRAQEIQDFLANMSQKEKADYERSYAAALEKSRSNPSPQKDTFLDDLKNKYGMSDRGAVLAWIRRERSQNCFGTK